MPRQIIGVMPAGFRFLNVEPELILTARFDRNRVFLGNFSLQGVARLKPGVTLQQANADLGRVLEIWKNAWPGPPGRKTTSDWQVRPALRPLKQDVVGDTGNALWVLMGTISMVLLIACANVANLLLVRTQSRQQELAVRASLGASRRRIAAGLFVECILLGLAGGVAGIALAYAALRLLVRIGPSNLPRLNELAIDVRTLSFALCASVFSGVLFSLMPVLKGAGHVAVTALRGAGRTLSQSKERHRASNVLVVAQVALALILLISSGLMIRTFQAMTNVEPGFTKPESIQLFRISLPVSQLRQPEQVVRMQVATNLLRFPGSVQWRFPVQCRSMDASVGIPCGQRTRLLLRDRHLPHELTGMCLPGLLRQWEQSSLRGGILLGRSFTTTGRWRWSRKTWPGSSGGRQMPPWASASTSRGRTRHGARSSVL
jgi:hypothetical protein